MKLNTNQSQVHVHAVQTSQKLKMCESELVQALIHVEEIKLYKVMKSSSLFTYAVKYLTLERSFAYSVTTLVRKCLAVPRLRQSVLEHKLSVSKASRIVSTLNAENAEEIVKFAEEHSTEEINLEVSRIRKKAGLKEKLNVLYVSDETLSKVRRARTLLGGDLDSTLNSVLNEYIERHDPLKKAERAARRKTKSAPVESVAFGSSQVLNTEGITHPFCRNRKLVRRVPLTAEQKHAVWARDQGRCTHIDIDGDRCDNERFLEIHHIVPVSEGGSNDLENLTLHCGFHHDQAHQLSFPIEGPDAGRAHQPIILRGS